MNITVDICSMLCWCSKQNLVASIQVVEDGQAQGSDRDGQELFLLFLIKTEYQMLVEFDIVHVRSRVGINYFIPLGIN